MDKGNAVLFEEEKAKKRFHLVWSQLTHRAHSVLIRGFFFFPFYPSMGQRALQQTGINTQQKTQLSVSNANFHIAECVERGQWHAVPRDVRSSVRVSSLGDH